MKKISIVSGKGGVGKTTVVALVARALAKLKYRVLVIDGDYSLNNLDITLGVNCNPNYDLSDYLLGRCRLSQILISDPNSQNVSILTSDKTPLNIERPELLKVGLNSLSRLYDFILIDAPAGVDEGFYRAVDLSDEVILVTTTFSTSIRDADKVISILEGLKIQKISLVLNMVRADLIAKAKSLSVLDVQNLLGRTIIGVIPYDDEILTLQGETLKKTAVSSKAFIELAKNLTIDKPKITLPK